MSESHRGHLAMLMFSLLVAGSFSFGSRAAPFIAPEALNAVRFALATGLIFALALATGGIPRSAWRAPWRYFVLAGFFTAYFVLMFEGLKTGAPVPMAAVFTLTPVMAAGFGWVLLRQITTGRMAVALTIGAIGALWVIFRADWQAFLQFRVGRGELVYFVGCIAHAIYAPLVPKLNRGERPIVFSLGTLIAGSILLCVFGAPALIKTDWANLPAIVWITILYTTIFASAATFVLLQYASLRIPSAKVMAYTYMTPSWVMLAEIALGGGLPTGMIMIGIGLTIVALLLLLKDDSAAKPLGKGAGREARPAD